LTLSLTPSKLPVIECPNRYARQYLRREAVPAPFLVTHLGSEVHDRIAHSLQAREEPSAAPFKLPARAILVAGQTVEDLEQRSRTALEEFRREHLPRSGGGLVECPVTLELRTPAGKVRVNARLDHLAVSTARALITDWKTGPLRNVRLQLATAAYWAHQALGLDNVVARAVSLTSGACEEVAWSRALAEEVEVAYGQAAVAVARVSGGEEPARPGGGCLWCPYALACQAVGEPPWTMVNTRTGEMTPLTRDAEKLAN
jgi:hypothetical protein